MDSFDNLKMFFEKIKSAGFWQRLFGWKALRTLSYEAYDEFRNISGKINELVKQVETRSLKISDLEKNNEIQASKLEDSRVSVQKLRRKDKVS